MLDTQKAIIKKAIEENLSTPAFINVKFKGYIGGWERDIDGDTFRRFAIRRAEKDGEIIHIIDIQDHWIGNPSKKKEGQNQGIKISLQSLKKLESYTLHDWLDVHHDLGKADEYVQGLIKFVADDLLAMELEKQKQAFLATL